MTAQSGVATDPDQITLPLLVLAALEHPEEAVRTPVRSLLRDWLRATEPIHTRREIVQALRQRNGTPVEPFVLSRRGRLVATLLAQAAFSEREGQTRFRVVSGDSLSTKGGVVLTNNLASFLVERFKRGRQIDVSESIGFMAPALMPTAQSIADTPPCRVGIRIDDEGIQIRVHHLPRLPGDTRPPGEWARDLTLHSAVRGGGPFVFEAEMRLDPKPSLFGFILRTTRTEALLRLSALMARNAVILLSSSDDGSNPTVAFRLRPLDRDAMLLPSVVVLPPSAAEGWMRFPTHHPPSLPLELRVAISRWIGPIQPWVDEPLLEALL